jgi:hypothetical protein
MCTRRQARSVGAIRNQRVEPLKGLGRATEDAGRSMASRGFGAMQVPLRDPAVALLSRADKGFLMARKAWSHDAALSNFEARGNEDEQGH